MHATHIILNIHIHMPDTNGRSSTGALAGVSVLCWVPPLEASPGDPVACRVPQFAPCHQRPAKQCVAFLFPHLHWRHLVAGQKDGRRVVACIGDGSFQVTAQDVSTMMRYGQNPIIILVNNGGYTIEVRVEVGVACVARQAGQPCTCRP